MIIHKESMIMHKENNKIPRKFGFLRGEMLVETADDLPGDIVFVRHVDTGYLSYNSRTCRYNFVHMATLRNGNKFRMLEVI